MTDAPTRAIPGSALTPLDPANVGFAARIVQAARYAITGVAPSNWFGPMQPLRPMAPPGADRVRDYETGFNLNYIPRAYEAITFDMLRALSYNCADALGADVIDGGSNVLYATRTAAGLAAYPALPTVP